MLFIDFETKSACDLKACGADKYARDPSTDILCMGYAFDDEFPELWTPDLPSFEQKMFAQTVLKAIEAGEEVVAQNANFEWTIWYNVARRRYGWPELRHQQLTDTMVEAYAMSLPANLDRMAGALGLEQKKDMAGNRVMLQLSQPRKVHDDGTITWWEKSQVPEKFAIMYTYCLQDIVVTREAFKRLMRLSADERAVWELDHEINQRGIMVDIPCVKAAIQIVDLEKARLDKEMVAITDDHVSMCSANAQLKKWVNGQGVDCDGVSKPVVTELLQDPDLPLKVRQALLLRQEAAKSSTAKLFAMIERACDDGRLRGTTQYHGASTGRWSGRGVQVQNLPRNTIPQNQIDEVFKLLEQVK